MVRCCGTASTTVTAPLERQFGELQGAVYAAPTAQVSKLLFSTAAHLPPPGHVSRQLLHIGADRWLLVASAR